MAKVGPSPRFAARQNRPPEFWQVPQRRDDAFRLLSHAGGIPRDSIDKVRGAIHDEGESRAKGAGAN
jgi:hypothetical protein